MLKVAWLYRQSEVSAEALPTDCDPREVVGRPRMFSVNQLVVGSM